MNVIRMDRVTSDSVTVFGGRVATQSIKMSEGFRKPMPYEDEDAEVGFVLKEPLDAHQDVSTPQP